MKDLSMLRHLMELRWTIKMASLMMEKGKSRLMSISLQSMTQVSTQVPKMMKRRKFLTSINRKRFRTLDVSLISLTKIGLAMSALKISKPLCKVYREILRKLMTW